MNATAIHTASVRLAPGPHLGGFPCIVRFHFIPAERDTGAPDAVELLSFHSPLHSFAVLGDWFTSKLSADQLADLDQQCLASLFTPA